MFSTFDDDAGDGTVSSDDDDEGSDHPPHSTAVEQICDAKLG